MELHRMVHVRPDGDPDGVVPNLPQDGPRAYNTSTFVIPPVERVVGSL